MKRAAGKKILIFLFFINPALVQADLDAASVRIEPQPIAQRLALGGEAVAPDDFEDAALVFSGVADADLAGYRGALDTIVAEVKKSFAGRPLAPALAGDLLDFLHAHYLKGYVAEETGLDRLLDAGVYNCVSSSVFYLIAADALGLPASGVRTKDHAFVKVTIGEGVYDVETTNRYGFDPGRRKEFFDAFGKMTGFVYTPPTNYADRQDIGRKEVLSLILSNRIALFAGARNYGPAVGVAADLFELVKNEETLKTFLGVFSGLAREALDGGQYTAGSDVLDRAVSRYRQFDQLQDLRRSFVRDWANRLVEKRAFAETEALAKSEYAQGKISPDDYHAVLLFRFRREAEAVAADPARGPAGALAVMAEAKMELGDDPALLAAEKAYAHNLVLELVEKGSFDEGQSQLEIFRSEKTIDEADYRGLTVYRVQRQAAAVDGQAGAREALRVVEKGIAGLGRDPVLLKSAGVYAYNWCLKLIQTGASDEAAAFLTGAQAAAYLSAETRRELALFSYTARADTAKNKNDYPGAVAVLEEGLTALGRNDVLLKYYEDAVHNRMLEFYKVKDYDQAEKTLLHGLVVYPSSALLKDDLSQIRKLKK